MSKKRAIGLKKEPIPNPAKDPAQDSLHLPRRMRVPHEMTYRYIDGTSEADWCANMYFHLISSFDSPILSKDSVTRAGHAKILSRQCDHVFRPQNCYLLQYYCIYLATPCRRRNLNIFSNFFCRLVVVAKQKIVACPALSMTKFLILFCVAVIILHIKLNSLFSQRWQPPFLDYTVYVSDFAIVN